MSETAKIVANLDMELMETNSRFHVCPEDLIALYERSRIESLIILLDRVNGVAEAEEYVNQN